jgi:predicted metal-dependent peptidase
LAEDLEEKLCAARTRLILDRPFLGALTLRLPLEEARGQWCTTAATDARKLYYNPRYVEALSLGQTQFLLAHLALHCALSHFARRQHRVRHRWDLACDLAINPLLVDEGLPPPPDALVMDDYRGMTAEEIYPLLDEQDETETLDQHVFDQDSSDGGRQGSPPPDTPPGGQGGTGGEHEPPPGSQQSQAGEAGGERPESSGDEGSPQGQGGGGQPGRSETAQDNAPSPLTPDERETLRVQWQQRLAGAAQQAMQAGKLDGAMARLVDHLLQPQLPWRMLLARYFTAAARDDYSYLRPSNRREGDAILPSLRSAQVDVVVAVDTSGSIGREELESFMAEVDALKGQVRAHLTLLACDADLAPEGPWEFEPWQELRLPRQLRGGGGTSFVPVFRFVHARERQPDLLIYFTDAEGEFPPREPPFPVIWLVKGRARVPWGQRVQLN